MKTPSEDEITRCFIVIFNPEKLYEIESNRISKCNIYSKINNKF